jgi:hypothetical protein
VCAVIVLTFYKFILVQSESYCSLFPDLGVIDLNN